MKNGDIHAISEKIGLLNGTLTSVNASLKKIETNQDNFLKDLTILNINQKKMDKDLGVHRDKIEKLDNRIQGLENSKKTALWVLGTLWSGILFTLLYAFDYALNYLKGVL